MGAEIFDVIYGFGVKPRQLSEAMDVAHNTLSQWRLGRRTLSEAVERDLWELAALLKAYAARGLKPQAALAAWRPSTLVTRWERETVEAQTMDVTLTGDLAEAMLALRGANNFPAQLEILLRATCREISAIEQEDGPLTIEKRMRLRRLAQLMMHNLGDLNQRDATAKERR
jgi:transcriptional regulator with XRE-family HTH domain